MPIYDLLCTKCGYEKDDVRFESYRAFVTARQERDCPDCHERLEAKLSTFNMHGTRKIKTTNGKIISKDLGLVLYLGVKPCGEIGPKAIGLAEVMHVEHDAELN